MILSRDINPEINIYFLGGKIIEILDGSKNKTVDFWKIYRLLRKSHNVSIKLTILALDWLYLLGLIKIDEQGKLVKCL